MRLAHRVNRLHAVAVRRGQFFDRVVDQIKRPQRDVAVEDDDRVDPFAVACFQGFGRVSSRGVNGRGVRGQLGRPLNNI